MTRITHTPDEDGEIDLIELLAKLWRSRLILIATTATGLILAGFYTAIVPKVWTSRATIAPPSFEQMGHYYLLKTKLDEAPLFSRSDNKISTNVLKQSTPANQITADTELGMQLFESAQLLLDTTPGITLLRPDGRKQQLFQAQTSAQTASEARQKLTQALTSVNQRLYASKSRELRSQQELLWLALIAEQKNIASLAQTVRAKELTSTRQALDSAKRAGLVQFEGSSYAGLEAPGMHYLLGSKLLQARLATLEQTPPEYPPRYYEIDAELKGMQTYSKIDADNFAGFQLVSPPSLPTQHDSPKSALIMVLGAICGLLLGCLWALGREALSKLCIKVKD